MAIPAMTNNAPSAGHIAWAAFSIQIYGTAYTVPAASTNQRWVWWLYNNGAPTIVAGPNVPESIGPDDVVLFANKNGIGIRVQSASLFDGELIVDGSILADAIGANQIKTEHMEFGSIDGDRIKARTITSDKVIVGNGDDRLLEELLEGYVQSRGTDLVTNGTGFLQDNTNFSAFDFVPSDGPPGSSGSFTPKLKHYTFSGPDEYIPITTTKTYQISAAIRQAGTSTTAECFMSALCYDTDGVQINSENIMYISGSTTTLAAPLNPGDTTITLTSSAGWFGRPGFDGQPYQRRIIFWDWVDGSGRRWETHSISRNFTAVDSWAPGGISGNVITLRAPYTGPAKPAGTSVSNSNMGSTYLYLATPSPTLATSSWTTHGTRITGTDTSGQGFAAFRGFPPGTATMRLLFGANKTGPGTYGTDPNSDMRFASISVSDASAAVARAEEAYSRWAPANQTTIDGGKITANSITGNLILGQTIGAEKLVVGDLANMAEINETRSIGRLLDNVTHTISNGWSTRDVNTSQYFMFRTQHGPVPFKTGERIRVTFDAYADAAVAANVSVWAYGNAAVSQLIGSAAVTTSIKSFDYQATVTFDTAGKTSFLIGLHNVNGRNVMVRDVRAYRMNAGELIVDGTIKTNMIETAGITAIKIASKAVGAEKLVVGDMSNISPLNEARSIGDLGAGAGDHVIVGGYSTRTVNTGDAFPLAPLTQVVPFKKLDRLRITFRGYSASAKTARIFVATTGTSVGLDANDTVEYPLAFTTTPTDYAIEIPITQETQGQTTYTIYISGVSNVAIYVQDVRIYRMGAGELVVDGSIKAEKLDVKDVAAQVIKTGGINSQLSITGTLEIDGTDQKWNSDGLRIGSKVKLHPDDRPNLIESDLVTSNVTVKDGLSIGGSADMHGEFIMSNGVTNPTARMSLGQTWPRISSSINNGEEDISNLYHGLVELDATTWLVPYGYYGFGTGLRKVVKTTGAWSGDLATASWSSSFYPIGGIAKIGTSFYLLGTDGTRGGDFYLYRVTTTGTIAKQAELRIGGPNTFNGKRPRLLTNGTNLGMVWTSYNGTLNLRWFNAAITSTVGADVQLKTGLGLGNVGGAHYGVGSPGEGDRIFVSMQSGDANLVRVFTTAGVAIAGEDFQRAHSSTVVGLAYDSQAQRLQSYDQRGYFSTYSRYATGGTLQAQYTYYDGDNSNYPAGTIINGVNRSGQASGAHETAPSPLSAFSLGRRAWPTVTAPPAPDELVTDVTQVDKANRLGVYAAIGGTPRLQGYLAVGVRDLTVTDSYSTNGVLAGSSTVPSFASAAVPAPGRVRSAAVAGGSPIIDLYGSGAGRLGPFQWDSAGKSLNHGAYVANTIQSIPNAAWTTRTGWVLAPNAPAASGLTYNASNGAFTVAQSGMWMATAAVTLANTTGTSVRRLVGIFRNGAVMLRQELFSTGTGQSVTPIASGVLYLNAGDVISVMVYQTSGAAVNTTDGADSNSFSLVCLGAF